MNKADLEQLTDLRLAEAVALLGLAPPMPDGAYYLADVKWTPKTGPVDKV